jgi:hypothetical protein
MGEARPAAPTFVVPFSFSLSEADDNPSLETWRVRKAVLGRNRFREPDRGSSGLSLASGKEGSWEETSRVLGPPDTELHDGELPSVILIF